MEHTGRRFKKTPREKRQSWAPEFLTAGNLPSQLSRPIVAEERVNAGEAERVQMSLNSLLAGIIFYPGKQDVKGSWKLISFSYNWVDENFLRALLHLISVPGPSTTSPFRHFKLQGVLSSGSWVAPISEGRI